MAELISSTAATTREHPDDRASQRLLDMVGQRRVVDDHRYDPPVWRYEVARSGGERPVPGVRR